MNKDNLKINKENKEKTFESPFDNNTGIPKNEKDTPIPSDRFYTEKEEVTLRFYQTPKALFNNPRYKGLSLGSKELESFKGQFGLGIERDLYFAEKRASRAIIR